jgi:lipopolysaccharide/colanic/teichoic acid biosynthesis glycosyltransferase
MRPYFVKRTVDLLAAGTACVVFAPLAAGIALATWLEDGGPPLFLRQSLSFDMRLIALSFAVSLVGKRRVRRWMRHATDKLPQHRGVTRKAPPFAAFQR